MNLSLDIYYVPEVVFVDDFLGDFIDDNANVFWSFEGGREVNFEMSIVMNLAFFVETTLLKIIFATNVSSVGVATLPG